LSITKDFICLECYQNESFSALWEAFGVVRLLIVLVVGWLVGVFEAVDDISGFIDYEVV